MSMYQKNMFFTSESVTEGHPDKFCDKISDGVLACGEEYHSGRTGGRSLIAARLPQESGVRALRPQGFRAGVRGRPEEAAGQGKKGVKLNIMAAYFFYYPAVPVRQKRMKGKTIWLIKR